MATVTVIGKNNYRGKAEKKFKINPKAPAVNRLASGMKTITVYWSKSVGAGGYEIQYSEYSSFLSAKTMIASGSLLSRIIKPLKDKKTYYFRIRSYKYAGGVRLYSAWSYSKSATTL